MMILFLGLPLSSVEASQQTAVAATSTSTALVTVTLPVTVLDTDDVPQPGLKVWNLGKRMRFVV